MVGRVSFWAVMFLLFLLFCGLAVVLGLGWVVGLGRLWWCSRVLST